MVVKSDDVVAVKFVSSISNDRDKFTRFNERFFIFLVDASRLS